MDAVSCSDCCKKEAEVADDYFDRYKRQDHMNGAYVGGAGGDPIQAGCHEACRPSQRFVGIST